MSSLMTNPISNTMAVTEVQERRSNAPAAARSEAREPGKAEAGADQVTLTSGARRLGSLVASAKAAPEVDEGRVAALREAIEKGEYQVDAGRIAEGLLAFDAMFGS